MKDYEVVGYVFEDGPVCMECCRGDESHAPVFAGSEEAESQCVECGDWLLDEEPEHRVRERRRAEEEAAEAEILEAEAREARDFEALLADAEEDIKEAEAMKRKALLKIELLKAKKVGR